MGNYGRGKSGGARAIYYYPQRIDPSVRSGHLRQEPESKPIRRREKGGARSDCSDQSQRHHQEEIAVMTKESKPKTKKRTPKSTAAGRSLLTSLDQALASPEASTSRTPRHPRPDRSSCSGRPAGYSTEPRPQPVTVCDAIRIHCRHNKKLGTGANTARWPGAHSSSGHRESSRCRTRRAAEGELDSLLRIAPPRIL